MKEKELLLLRLVERMFEKQQTFLLIDELYEDEIIGTYIRNIQIDSPYQQLLFEGVLSQFSQGEELVVSITVENYFHHLLGLILQKDDRYQSSESLIQLIKSNNLKGLKEGVSNLLNLDIELGNFDRITELIDLSDGDETVTGICVTPLVNALLIHGVEKTIEVILENPTENDWKVLFRLGGNLDDLQLHFLRKDFLIELMPHNPLQTKNEVWLGLKAITIFDKDDSLVYLSKIDTSVSFIQEDPDLLFQLGTLENNFDNYDNALEYFEKSLSIQLKNLGENHYEVAKSYTNIGQVWLLKRNYDRALEYNEKSLTIRLKTLGDNHASVAASYNNIGLVWRSKGFYNKALEFYEKSLVIYLKTKGGNHSFVATIYTNIGHVWQSKGNHDKALEYYEKSLTIRLKTLGDSHLSVATSYNNIGLVWRSKGNYNKALEFIEKSLVIYLKTIGDNHSFVVTSYNNLGQVWRSKGNLDKALEYFEKSLTIGLETLGDNHASVGTSYNNIGLVWRSKGNYDKALEFYEKSLQIYLITTGDNHTSVATIYNNIGSIWRSKVNYDKALEYYEKCISIELKTKGKKHQTIALRYQMIGDILKKMNNYDIAILNFEKGYAIQKLGGFPFNIAQCYEALNDKINALDYYIQSAEIRKEDPNVGLEAESTQESISNAIRLAKELDKEHELPEWMKNNN